MSACADVRHGAICSCRPQSAAFLLPPGSSKTVSSKTAERGGKNDADAVVEVYKGVAVATASADAVAEAAADALAKLEVDRAMRGYGSFDSRSGLVVATTGRNAAVHASLLAATARGFIGSILVVEGLGSAKMAGALSAGIEEQIEAERIAAQQPAPGGASMMSHAGVTPEESAAWSSAIRGDSGGRQTTAVAQVVGGDDCEEDNADWAMLQGHLGLGGPADEQDTPPPGSNSGGGATITTTVSMPTVAATLTAISEGGVDVLCFGADAVDPDTHDAGMISDGAIACQLAEATTNASMKVPTLVICTEWGTVANNAPGECLPGALIRLTIGLPPR